MSQPFAVDQDAVKQEIAIIAGDALARVKAIVITTPEQRELAAALGAEIKTREDKLLEKKTKHVGAARKVYEDLREMFDSDIKPFAKARQTLSALISAYDVEQERLAKLERERKEKERREREEAENRRLKEMEILQAHDMADAEDRERTKARAEQLAREEKERQLKKEQDARLKQAETAESLGMPDRVSPILEQPTAIPQPAPVELPAVRPSGDADIRLLPPIGATPAPPPAPPPPVLAPAPVSAKAASKFTVGRDEWKVECVDPRALAQAILDGKAPAAFMEFTFKSAAARAEAVRLGSLFKCPGVRAWKERRTDFKRQDQDTQE